ncbi:MAG: hypothetical protein JXB40_00545 [Candidatus Omnitrophica bacterium]|nr:hypothetical protein [Candidatus Omnitrophota bacterium]
MKILKYICKSENFIISLFYSLAYGIMLFNDGVYIDGWCFYHVAKPAIMNMTKSYGNPWDGYIFSSIFSFDSLIIPRLAVFFLFLLSALFLNKTLKEIKEMDDGSRLSVVLLFAILPVNFARIALCAFTYAISYFAFFLGLMLFSRYFKTRGIMLRLATLLIFIISFCTNSLLVLYMVSIILFILYKERGRIGTPGEFIVGMLRYTDFLVIAPAFWIAKNVFLKPCDFYAWHNNIALSSVLSAPIRSIQAFNDSFVAVINNAFNMFLSNACLCIIFGFAVFLFLSKTVIAAALSGKSDIKLFFLGLILFFAAAFPYLAVDHIPRFIDWDSRNQLLLPLGFSLALYYGMRLFCNRLRWGSHARLFLYSLMIALFISVNFKAYVDYQKDWFKQLSLVENFRASSVMKNNTTFIFDDQASDMNAMGRFYRFYEYTGLMKLAFNDETRFGMSLDMYNKLDWSRYFIDNKRFIELPEYNISGYRPRDPEFKVMIKPGSSDLSRMYKVIRALYYKLFDHVKFKKIIVGLVKLEYVRL